MVWRQIKSYFEKYGFMRGLWRVCAKLLSPLFRPLLLASLRRVAARKPDPDGQYAGQIHAANRETTDKPPRVAVLIIDTMIGGGANRFSASYRKNLEEKGMAVAVAVYNIQTRKYAIHWRDESGDIHKTAQNRVHLLRLIEAAAPDSIFCNNLVSWPEPLSWLSWLTRMAETIPVRFYVHDFFCLCPTIILLDRNLRFCGLPEDKTVCAACLWRNLFAAPHTPASIFVWRDAWRAFLLACETIWIPHGCTGAMVAQVYPDIRNKLLLYQKTQAVTGNSPSLPSSAPTVIAAVGTMDIHKGGAIVAELADLLRRGGEEKKMIVIGEMKVPYPSDAVFVTGRYARDALPSLLVQYGVTLCLVPSICPESYCYVVDELMALGMPVVCFDLGAQGAKCREYPRGMAVNEISAQACLEAIRTMETARKEGLAAKVTA